MMRASKIPSIMLILILMMVLVVHLPTMSCLQLKDDESLNADQTWKNVMQQQQQERTLNESFQRDIQMMVEITSRNNNDNTSPPVATPATFQEIEVIFLDIYGMLLSRRQEEDFCSTGRNINIDQVSVSIGTNNNHDNNNLNPIITDTTEDIDANTQDASLKRSEGLSSSSSSHRDGRDTRTSTVTRASTSTRSSITAQDSTERLSSSSTTAAERSSTSSRTPLRGSLSSITYHDVYANYHDAPSREQVLRHETTHDNSNNNDNINDNETNNDAYKSQPHYDNPLFLWLQVSVHRFSTGGELSDLSVFQIDEAYWDVEGNDDQDWQPCLPTIQEFIHEFNSYEPSSFHVPSNTRSLEMKDTQVTQNMNTNNSKKNKVTIAAITETVTIEECLTNEEPTNFQAFIQLQFEDIFDINVFNSNQEYYLTLLEQLAVDSYNEVNTKTLHSCDINSKHITNAKLYHVENESMLLRLDGLCYDGCDFGTCALNDISGVGEFYGYESFCPVYSTASVNDTMYLEPLLGSKCMCHATSPPGPPTNEEFVQVLNDNLLENADLNNLFPPFLYAVENTHANECCGHVLPGYFDVSTMLVTPTNHLYKFVKAYIADADRAPFFNVPINCWNMSKFTDLSNAFEQTVGFNERLDCWDVSSVDCVSFMFSGSNRFNSDLSTWNFSPDLIPDSMFYGAFNFNVNLESWDVSKMRRLTGMFRSTYKINGDITNWNTSSLVRAEGMFDDAPNFNQNISGWDMSKVINTYRMFHGATAFNQDLSRWDVSSLRGSYDMFREAVSFNSDISSWNVSSLHCIEGMFYGATNFNQNLCAWFNSSGVLGGEQENVFNDSGCEAGYVPNSEFCHYCDY